MRGLLLVAALTIFVSACTSAVDSGTGPERPVALDSATGPERPASPSISSSIPDGARVVAKGDVKGFGWELTAHTVGDDTCYTVRYGESVVDSACAAPARASVARASLIYIGAVPFAVGIAGSEVAQVRIEYSIEYTIITSQEERQVVTDGSLQQDTVGGGDTEGRLFIAALPKGARLGEVSAAG